MYPEAKGVLDLSLAEAKPGLEDPIALIVHSVASSLMGRPEAGSERSRQSSDRNQLRFSDVEGAGLMRVRANGRRRARNSRTSEFAITSLPIDLQRILIADAMRASIEVKDYSGAAKRSSDLDVVGIPQEMKPAISVLRGRLAEGARARQGCARPIQARDGLRDRAAASEAKLLTLAMKQRRNEIIPADVLREVETLSIMWRGDGVEVRTLQILGRLYAEKGRYSESFAAARTATRLQPNSDASRRVSGRCRGAVRPTVSQPQRRRSSGGRRACDVLRIS